jgi:hypothetical protein
MRKNPRAPVIRSHARNRPTDPGRATHAGVLILPADHSHDGATPVAAHHSHNNYAIAESIPLHGIVKEVHLINPHTSVYLEVHDKKGEPRL